MKAITTKYFGPSNTKGSYIKASIGRHKGGSIILPYPHEKSADEAHTLAAETLAKKLGWKVILRQGYIEHLGIYAHVIVKVLK